MYRKLITKLDYWGPVLRSEGRPPKHFIFELLFKVQIIYCYRKVKWRKSEHWLKSKYEGFVFLLTLKIFYVYLWCRIKFVSGWIFSHKLSIYCISVHEVCFELPPPPKPSNLDQVAYFALVYHFYAIKTIILSVFFWQTQTMARVIS